MAGRRWPARRQSPAIAENRNRRGSLECSALIASRPRERYQSDKAARRDARWRRNAPAGRLCGHRDRGESMRRQARRPTHHGGRRIRLGLIATPAPGRRGRCRLVKHTPKQQAEAGSRNAIILMTCALMGDGQAGPRRLDQSIKTDGRVLAIAGATGRLLASEAAARWRNAGNNSWQA